MIAGVPSVWAFIRQHWKLAAILTFAGLYLMTRVERDAARQALKTEQSDRKADNERAGRQRAAQERGFAERQAIATSTLVEKLAAREPIIVHSTNTVREYAQTDAGRARCLGADRVRGLDAYHAALAGTDPGTAGRRAEGVRADPDPAPAGR